MTPQELSGRGDLLDMIDQAVAGGTAQERLDLLTAAAIRIRALNTEHDAMCESREQAVEEAAAARAGLGNAAAPLL